jgi:hypothetical protein
MFDVIGAVVACAGVAVIYYAPRRGEEKLRMDIEKLGQS